jgi:hypothetical protein
MRNVVAWRDGLRVVKPAPVPASVSRFQARAVLMDMGLLADVEAALESAGPLAQLAWAEATEFPRNSPTIAAIGSALGLSGDEIDDLFRVAATISA